MPIAVTGSVATDHLMSFPGRFADSLVVDQLDKIALSFLVDDLEVRRGGCAANIAFGLGALGADPVLVAAVGEDFADYRSWLERHRVDCESLHYSDDPAHGPLHLYDRLHACPDRVVLRRGDVRGARDRARARSRTGSAASTWSWSPRTTRRRCCGTARSAATGATRSWRTRPSSSPGRTGPRSAASSRAPRSCMSNEYEAALIEQKTGWTADDILDAGGDPGRHARPGGGSGRTTRRGADRRTGRPGSRRRRADRSRRRVSRGLRRRRWEPV